MPGLGDRNRVRWTDILGRPTQFGSGLTPEQAAILDALIATTPSILVRTTSGFVVRSIARNGQGLRITNGNGVAGNPTLELTDDVGAIENLTGDGYLRRVAANSWVLDPTILWAAIQGTPTSAVGYGIVNGDELDGFAALADAPGFVAKLGAGSYDLITLAAVALTGEYGDLLNKPAIREVLTANRTYFVATTGNNANDGLTVGTPFLTVQFAIDTLAAIDTGNFNVIIQVADGTYAENVVLKLPLGSGTLTLRGNTTTPANVIIAPGSGNAISHDIYTARWTCEGLRVAGSSAVGVVCNSGKVTLGVFSFGACTRAHMESIRGGRIDALGSYTINGGAQWHYTTTAGIILTGGNTVTLTGTPAFSQAFARATSLGSLGAFGVTFVGGATGSRYRSELNGVIDTNGGGANFFPGNAAGTTATGGQYN